MSYSVIQEDNCLNTTHESLTLLELDKVVQSSVVHCWSMYTPSLCDTLCVRSNQSPVTVAPVVKAAVSGRDAPLCSASGFRQHILQRRPGATSLSHSRVPTPPHESSRCGKCGWLLSCDYSLTHLSRTRSQSSS